MLESETGGDCRLRCPGGAKQPFPLQEGPHPPESASCRQRVIAAVDEDAAGCTCRVLDLRTRSGLWMTRWPSSACVRPTASRSLRSSAPKKWAGEIAGSSSFETWPIATANPLSLPIVDGMFGAGKAMTVVEPDNGTVRSVTPG